MSEPDLRDLSPSEGVALYLDDRRSDDVAARTINTYRDHLERFTEWCERSEIGSLSDFDGMTFRQYKMALADGYAPATVQNHLGTVKRFLEWCVAVDAVDPMVPERIEVKRDTYARSGEVPADAAEKILARLRKFRYASLDHVTFALMWRIGARLGTLRAFDVDDFRPAGEGDVGPHIRAVHRPETGTPLKNGEDGQRPISLHEGLVDVLTDYIAVERPDVTDSHGREPLLATPNGRAARSTLRAILYGVTRPCWYGDECPVGRSPDECDAADYKRHARKCPENNSPHDVRRGRLTHYRREEVPKEVIADRSDVSPDVLEKHYNEMSDGEKMEQRRGYLDNV